jgi:hypothetical protein
MATKKTKSKKTATAKPKTDGAPVAWIGVYQAGVKEESAAKDFLRLRREYLETLVSPHVASRESNVNDPLVVQLPLKGKVHSVRANLREPGQIGSPVQYAVLALDCLDKLDAAISAGKTDEVIRWTYQFALFDIDSFVSQICGRDALSTAVDYYATKSNVEASHQSHVKAGEGKRKFKTEAQRHELLEAFVNNCRRSDWLTATRDELVDLRLFKTLSKSAVKKELQRMQLIPN